MQMPEVWGEIWRKVFSSHWKVTFLILASQNTYFGASSCPSERVDNGFTPTFLQLQGYLHKQTDSDFWHFKGMHQFQ